ncbi:DUF488 domain-containing protein [Acinetobacter sp. GXMZU3951]
MQIQIKRVYSPVSPEDGIRILVDRLWPRGITKDQAKIDLWPKAITPSTVLRQWYHQDLSQWEAFRATYLLELAQSPEILAELRTLAVDNTLTLITAAKNETHNHALVLKALLLQQHSD